MATLMLPRKEFRVEKMVLEMSMGRMDGMPFLLFRSLFLFALLSHSLHGCPLHELKALFSIKESLDDRYRELKSWEGDNCCTCSGVYCDELEMGRPVYKLDIHYFGLEGTMNLSLLELKHLKNLDSGGNDLLWDGLMFQGLGSLTNLTYLDISISYSGSDEEYNLTLKWLSNLSSLEHLVLNRNKLQGSEINSVIGRLSKLNHLELHSCGLKDSSVLSSLANMSKLASLDLSFNRISGPILSWMGNMRKLTLLGYMDLSYNKLSGQISSSLGNLSALVSLDLKVIICVEASPVIFSTIYTHLSCVEN